MQTKYESFDEYLEACGAVYQLSTLEPFRSEHDRLMNVQHNRLDRAPQFESFIDYICSWVDNRMEGYEPEDEQARR